MYQSNWTIVHPHGYMNAKRTLQSRRLPKDVVVGIVLAVIAVIASALVALLLWHLYKQSRADRRRAANQVDLLGSENARATFMPFGDPEELYNERPWDKPLPRIPSAISIHPYDPVNAQESPGVIRRPLPIYYSPGERPISRLVGNSQDAPIQHLSLGLPPTPFDTTSSSFKAKPAHARTNTISSMGNAQTYSSRRSPYDAVTSESDASDIRRGQFTIVNVTDAEPLRFDRAQLLSYDVPPDYAVVQVRGRDVPFPQKRSPPDRSVSVMPPVIENKESLFSYVTSNEKSGISDVPSSSVAPYMVQVPIPRTSSTPPSPLLPPRMRSPLTLTASYPVSNVVIGDIGPVRRPDGSKGKGRMVTMSVLVDDSDSSASVKDASEGQRDSGGRPNSNSSESSQGVLGVVLSGYTTDLPPYTPAREEGLKPEL
ncbi:hypothetical protein JB92DRAFT_3037758 [Gautieria morchelliformis]|nr:hypothetical protein JB92DRAFT_3037758 [Gautieria morchelliformis]